LTRCRRFESGSATTSVRTPATSIDVFWPSNPIRVGPRFTITLAPGNPGAPAYGRKPSGGVGWLMSRSSRPGRYSSRGVSVAFQPGHTGLSGLAITPQTSEAAATSIGLTPSVESGAAMETEGRANAKQPARPRQARDGRIIGGLSFRG